MVVVVVVESNDFEACSGFQGTGWLLRVRVREWELERGCDVEADE